jgi:hypothetical protein
MKGICALWSLEETMGNASGLLKCLGWLLLLEWHHGVFSRSTSERIDILTEIASTFNTSVPDVIGKPTQGQSARGPWFNAALFAYFKNTQITEPLAAQLRVEAFDIVNHTQRRAVDARKLQLGLRVTLCQNAEKIKKHLRVSSNLPSRDRQGAVPP